jgi:glycosyltransferase involved in cell wall biosynthesis
MLRYLIVLPAYNEEGVIKESLLTLNDFLVEQGLHDQCTICVSDNNSQDATQEIVKNLQKRISNLEYHYVPVQGKGIAIASAWDAYKDMHEFFIFMDADLATDLQALPILMKKLESYDVVIGDRYHAESKVHRTSKRKIVSYGFRTVIRFFLQSHISDFPCGFKGIRKDIVLTLVPKVQNRSWFFDSELMYLCEKQEKTICHIPVTWKDPRPQVDQSKVQIIKVSRQYIREVLRLARGN